MIFHPNDIITRTEGNSRKGKIKNIIKKELIYVF